MVLTQRKREKLRIGVLRGGPSHQYDISLLTGANVLKNLPEEYTPVDIFISREGEWHLGGISRKPEKILPQVDVVFNALHGRYGEDGKIQNLLRHFGVPYTGTESLPGAFSSNKYITKALFEYHNLKTPEYAVIYPNQNTYSDLIQVFRSLPQPSIIKPMDGASSVAVTFADNFEKFREGIERAFRHSESVIVEEYIPGTEVFCGVLESSDGKTLYSLFPIAPKRSGQIFSSSDRKNFEIKHEYPAPISEEVKEVIQRLALSVHKHLNLRHYSGIDVVVHPTRGVYLLEVDALPELHENSLFTLALKAGELELRDFTDHVIELARNR